MNQIREFSNLKSFATSLLLVLLMIVILPAAGRGQILAKKSRSSSAPQIAPQAPKPALLNADSNPTLRFPACAWVSSVSCGWLDLTRSGVRYTAIEQAKKGGEAFEAGYNELKNFKMERTQGGGSILNIATSRRGRMVIYAPAGQWASTLKGRDFLRAAKMNLSGTISIELAMRDFEGVLASVKPPPVPAPELTFHAEPATIEKGRSVTLVWTSSNATHLDLEPGGVSVPPAGGTSLTPSESTTYTLTATGPGGTKTVSVQVTVTQAQRESRPTLVLVEPSAAGAGQTLDVENSPLTIRGVVMDASGIPAVSINGSPVTMRPTSAQAAEFTSDPMVLQPGENRFEVSATNTAHAETKVAFVARFTPPQPKAPAPEQFNPKGLAKAEIVGLLRGEVPNERVVNLVKERGIKFVPTEDDLQEIRAAGGSDDLIDALRLKQAASPPK